jgi:hypothetical protein
MNERENIVGKCISISKLMNFVWLRHDFYWGGGIFSFHKLFSFSES